MQSETSMLSAQEKTEISHSNQQSVFVRDPATIGRQLKRPSAPQMNRSHFIPPNRVENSGVVFKKPMVFGDFKLPIPTKRLIPPIANTA